MVDDLQYPSVIDDDTRCSSHSQIDLEQFGFSCPICNNQFVYLLNEGISFKVPSKINHLSFFYNNLSVLVIFLILFNLEWFFSVFVVNIIILTFPIIFKRLADGAKDLTGMGYNLLGVFTGFFFIISVFLIMISGSLPSFSITYLTILFLSMSIYVYSDSATRSIMKLTDTQKLAITSDYSYSVSYLSTTETIIRYAKQSIVSMVYVTYQLVNIFLIS